MLADSNLRTEELDRGVDWSRARCRDGAATMVGLFFSEEIGDIARAKAICRSCPLVDACLQGAQSRREPWGVWGGELFAGGRILVHKRRRGRPAKNPAVARTA